MRFTLTLSLPASSTTQEIPGTTTTVPPDRTIDFSTSPMSTTTTRTATAHRRLLFTHKPWIYRSSSTARSLTAATEQSTKTSTEPLPVSTAMMKATLPIVTPWYSPAGPFDWWQWQWYTTKSRKASVTISSTVTTPTTPPSTTTATTTTTSTRSTTVTTVTSTTQRSSTTTTRKTTPTATTTTASTKTSTKTTKTTTATTSSATKKITTTITTEPTSSSTRATSTAKAVTMDWFKLPFEEAADVKKNPQDNFDKEYKEWLAYLTTNEIQGIMTSTVTSETVLPLSPKQQQQGSSSASTKSTWSLDHRAAVTVNTPPAKRQHSQQSPGVSERNAVAIPNNGKNVAIDVQGHSLGVQPMIESSLAVSRYTFLGSASICITVHTFHSVEAWLFICFFPICWLTSQSPMRDAYFLLSFIDYEISAST